MDSVPTMQEEKQVCPYIARMGICLEPKMCCLIHNTMSMNAKEFVPGSGAEIPEWTPDEAAQPKMPEGMKDPNLNVEFMQDDEFGAELMFVESRMNCACCKGYVNACDGEACANLGICFCMVVDQEDVDLM